MPCASCEPRHFSLATMCPNGTCMGPVPPGGLPSIGGLNLMRGMQDGTLADSPAHRHFTRSPGLFGRRPTAECSLKGWITDQSLRTRRVLSWKTRPLFPSPVLPLKPWLGPHRGSLVQSRAGAELATPAPVLGLPRHYLLSNTSGLPPERPAALSSCPPSASPGAG